MAIDTRRTGFRIPLVALAVLLVGCCGGSGGGGGGNGGDDSAPTIVKVSPDSMFPAVLAIVTLTGSGFMDDAAGTTEVLVGGKPADKVTVLSDTKVLCRVPPGAPGSVDVVLTNDNGTARLVNGFTYYTDPPVFLASDRRLETDDAGAARSEYAKICCAGEHVYTAWEDLRNGEADVYFNHSADGGQTWQALDLRLDSDTPGAAASYDISICCEGSAVYVLWHDERNGGSDLYLNRSLDGGVTWLPNDRRLHAAAGASFKSTSSLCCENGSLYVAWNDNRNGQYDIYFNRSTDGGSTWLAADRRICTDTAGATRSGGPHLACEDGRLAVVWVDRRDDADADAVYFNGSSDGGSTWLGADVRVDNDGLNAGDAGITRVCHSTTGLCVVWYDDRNGENDVFANHSTDGGLTWRRTDERLDSDTAGITESRSIDLCCSGAIIGVVWRDRGGAGGEGVHFNRSSNGGRSFLSSDKRISAKIADSVVNRPRICCEGEQMVVVWSDSRGGGPYNIYLNRSYNKGDTWLQADIRLDTDGVPSAGSFSPRVCCEGARLHIAWHDDRNGETDVYCQSSVPE